MVMHFSHRLCRSGSALLLALGLVCWPWWCAAQEAGQATFYHRHKEGWFWYHDPALAVEEEVAEQAPDQKISPDSQEANRYRTTDLTQYDLQELWTMYPDDFQELLNHVQNLAVQEPTEDNVLRYLVMQDVARRKALAYTNASMYVTQKYGQLLSVNQVYPTAKPGVTARVQQQQQEIEQTIARASRTHALLYFTSPTCPFCDKQDAILHYFAAKYGWRIRPVDIARQPATAARFGIATTPTLLLINKGVPEYMPVAVGVVALTELERKLYRAIRYLQGQTGDATFLLYDFEQGSPLDPTSILHQGDRLWQNN